MEIIEFDGLTTETFAVDSARRTMRGVVVPWGRIGQHTNGRKWRFARGSLVYAAAKYLRFNDEHSQKTWLGRAISAEDTDAGLVVTFKVDAGPAGDRALADAQSGRKTGLSIEVEIDTADTQPDPENASTLLVNMAHLTGVGHVVRPAFNDSRLISVTASATGEDTGMDPDTTTTAEETTTAETVPALPPVTLSSEQFSQFLERVTPPAANPGEVRPTVNPTTRPVSTAEVSEPLPYRFSRHDGRHVFAADAEHDFSTDLFAVIRAGVGDGGDPVLANAARQRLDTMIGAAFAARSTTAMFADVESADVTALNPNRHRPDLWQPQMDYATPLWDMVDSGTTDGSKFDVPKFVSAAGLVVPAVEKTEPASGSYVAELQTITPTQVWGKVEVTRQAWRAGGNPALSGILWDQMLREYYEDREAAVATFLATLTAATDITLTGRPAASPTNEHDQTTVGDFSAAQTDLQFVRGGNRFRAFAVHQDLYRVFARVTDDAGRPLYPMINPANANGTARSLYRTIDINGTTAVPSWALGAGGQTTPQNSWLFDPAVVRGWASAPERMFWDFGATVQTANIPQLSFVTLGIYGDVAFANINIAGVRQVIFDPSV